MYYRNRGIDRAQKPHVEEVGGIIFLQGVLGNLENRVISQHATNEPIPFMIAN